MYLKKTPQAIFITIISDLLNAKLKINLLDKQLSLESTVALDKLSQIIKVPFEQQKLRNRLQGTFRYGLAGDRGARNHVLAMVKKRLRKKPFFCARHIRGFATLSASDYQNIR